MLMPCGGASGLRSFVLVSALLLPSAALALSADADGACLQSGLLTLETMVSRVVTVCFSVRRSRSSVDLTFLVRGLPDNVLLCAGRSGPDAGEFAPDLLWVLDSKWLLVVFSWAPMRGIRDDAFSPAEPLLLLLSACRVLYDIVAADHIRVTTMGGSLPAHWTGRR